MSVREALTPSFRNRLRLFFVVIVIVPMITMAVVLFQLIVRSEPPWEARQHVARSTRAE